MQWMTNEWKTSQNIRIAKVMFNRSWFICCSVRNGAVIQKIKRAYGDMFIDMRNKNTDN